MANPFIIPAASRPSVNTQVTPLSQSVNRVQPHRPVDTGGLQKGIAAFGQQMRERAERQAQINALADAPEHIQKLAQVDPELAARTYAAEVGAQRNRQGALDFQRENDPFYGKDAEELATNYGLSPEDARLASAYPGFGEYILKEKARAAQQAEADARRLENAIEKEERKAELKNKQKEAESAKERQSHFNFVDKTVADLAALADGNADVLEQRLGVLKGTKAYSDWLNFASGKAPLSDTLRKRIQLMVKELGITNVAMMGEHFKPISEAETELIAKSAFDIGEATDVEQFWALLSQYQRLAMRRMGKDGEYTPVEEMRTVVMPDGSRMPVKEWLRQYGPQGAAPPPPGVTGAPPLANQGARQLPRERTAFPRQTSEDWISP